MPVFEKEILIPQIKKFIDTNHYSSLNIKAVLIDMDGVLYDSMKNHARSWKMTADKYNIPSDENEFYLYEGQTGRYTINYLFERSFGRKASEAEIKEVYTQKTDFFTSLGQAPVMPGAKETLLSVTAHNLTPVLVTGSGQDSLLGKLDHNFPAIFNKSRMVTAKDVSIGKPDPEPYLMGLKKAGVSANEAIVIENAPLGVRSAVATGIFTIAVNTGPIDDNMLYNEGANIVLQSMKELSNRFDSIIKTFNLFK
ncbi:MAG: HAD-IA family hydrolase [Bacteroidales bacterium]|nr:HAD-IA family hydrolase [Bacteroidales bacterium]